MRWPAAGVATEEIGSGGSSIGSVGSVSIALALWRDLRKSPVNGFSSKLDIADKSAHVSRVAAVSSKRRLKVSL